MERMSPLEFKRWLEKRTKDFSVAVLKYLDALPKKSSSSVIANQLGRSASSIGANYREANRAESGVDFRHKISIALKEANETLYWLEILVDLYPMHGTPERLKSEADELLRLLQSISRSSRKRTLRPIAQSNNLNNQNNRTIRTIRTIEQSEQSNNLNNRTIEQSAQSAQSAQSNNLNNRTIEQ